MKKIFTILILSALLFSINTVSAQTTTSDRSESRSTIRERLRTSREVISDRLEKYRGASQEQNTERLRYLREYAQKLIDRRHEILTSLRERIAKYKDLTDEEKRELLNTVSDSESALAGLFGRIGSEKDLDQLKIRVREVADQKIFEYVVPKVRLRAIEGKIGAVLNRMRAITEKVENVINRAEAAGHDTSSIESKFSEYKGQLVIAQNAINEAKNLINSLSSETEDVKSIFEQAKTQVKNAHESLKLAHRLIKEITSDLKELAKTNSEDE